MPPSDSPNDFEGDRKSAGPSSASRSSRFGVALILLSGVLWFSLFAIPFLPLTVGQKAAIAGADFVAVQIAWWIGAALAGPKLVAKLTSRFRRRKTTDES
jgi:hypothetical protein